MSASLFRLDGKIAVVTGGSRGLGLDIAEGFLLAGAARIYLSSRKASACDEAAKYLNDLAASKGLKGKAIAIAADVSGTKGIEHLVAEFAKHESKLDILIANAGATWGEDFETHSEKAIDKVLGLNVKGVFLTIQKFAPFLLKAGTAEDPSRVLITGSVAGIRSGMSGGTYGYLASKAAVHHIGRTLAVELGPQHITVNVLAPGFFPTKMASGLLEVIGEEMIESNPRRRLGIKDDIISASLYLVSPGGSYVNGIILPIDGGAHLAGKI